MAPVSATRERAQLIVVGGLALALTLVVLAVILNGAIYTENLASRGDGIDSTAVLAHQEAVDRDVGGLVDRTNTVESGADYTTLFTRLGNGIDTWEATTGRSAGVDGTIVEASVVREMRGVRVVDEDGSRAFLPRGDAPAAWTVAADARVRQFRLTVHDPVTAPTSGDVDSALDPSDPDTGVFVVEFDDGTDVWRMAVYGDEGDVGVSVYDGSDGSVTTCGTTASAPATIDLAAGTVGGTRCSALDSVHGLSGDYDVRYLNGDLAVGTFDLVADRTVDAPGSEAGAFTDAVDTENYDNHCGGPTYYGDAASGSPYVTPAMYSTTVNAEFENRAVTTTTTHRLAPGELGDGAAESPVVVQFDVADPTADDEDFTVTWDTSDPDGDDPTVTIVVEGTGGEEEDEDTETFTSPDASGSQTVSAGDEDGSEYTVTLIVEDSDGLSRSVTQVHADDGDDGECPA